MSGVPVLHESRPAELVTLKAAAPFVDGSVTVIVEAVAADFLGRNGATLATKVEETFVDITVAVIIERVTYFDRLVCPADSAGVGEVLIGLAVTIVIQPIAELGCGENLAYTGLNTVVDAVSRAAVADAVAESSGLTAVARLILTTATRARRIIVDCTVAVVVQVVATDLQRHGAAGAARVGSSLVDFAVAVVVVAVAELIKRRAIRTVAPFAGFAELHAILAVAYSFSLV
ncbi:MAG: hypothetical protein ACJAYU_005354, partial [Bradymonadia bacterium]